MKTFAYALAFLAATAAQAQTVTLDDFIRSGFDRLKEHALPGYLPQIESLALQYDAGLKILSLCRDLKNPDPTCAMADKWVHDTPDKQRELLSRMAERRHELEMKARAAECELSQRRP